MKTNLSKMNMLLALLVFTAILAGCKKENNTSTNNGNLTLTSLTAGGVDLNAATAPTNVPGDADIIATFNQNINESSIANKIFLVRSYDKDTIPTTNTVSGSKITIHPSQNLGTGSQYQLYMLPGITSTSGQSLASITRTFTTTGSFAPAGMVAYWNFENNVNDQVGSFNPSSGGVIDLTYAPSYKTAAGMAGQFNGSTTLVEIPNGDRLDSTDNFSLSFWVKADSTKHGQFVMGLAGWFGFQFEIAGDYKACKLAAQYRINDGTSASEDLWFNGEPLTPQSWVGWTFSKDLTGAGGVQYILADKWAHVACVYNATTKVGTLYLNGEKVKQQDFNLWPAGDPKKNVVGLKYAGHPGNNTFVFGFIQDKVDPSIPDDWAKYEVPTNNHFKGLLDDVRIFHSALTEQEVQLMYNSEKP